MNNYSKTLLAVAFVLAFSLSAMPTTAQGSTGFGTQVKLGDVDFRPTAFAGQGALTVTDAAAQFVVNIDFGIAGQITDNCIYYRQAAAGTNVVNFNVRLTPCQGKAAGTFVSDTDTVEKATAYVVPVATDDSVTRFADVNSNGRLDMGDCVFLTYRADGVAAGVSANILASTGNAQWTVRMTPCMGKEAGTFVFAGDADLTAYGAATTLIATATSGVAFFDADNSGTQTTGDSLYFVPVAVVAGNLFPQYSVRIQSPQGAFGSQVKLGDLDFIPVAGAGGAVVPIGAGAFAAAAGQVFVVDFGIAGQVTDNCMYYRHAAVATAAPVNFDLRLTPCQGKAAGTLVSDADVVEKATAAIIAPAASALSFGDVNNNGRYDNGDCVVFSTTAAAAAWAASTANGAWTIRLTPCGSFAAGTMVFAGDSDFTSYSAAAAHTAMPGGTGVAFFDADNNGAVSTGDVLVLENGGVAAGGLFGQSSVRLVGGSGAYGTQLKLGDSDFLPTLITGNVAQAPAVSQNAIDFGIAAQVTDNCFYIQAVASGTGALTNFNVRVTPCQGNAAGTMIGDTSTVEKATAPLGTAGTQVNYADVNNNGRYDLGDCVFLVGAGGAATTLIASTTNTAWTVRLTPCMGKEAGTLVFAGDADMTAYGAAASSTGAFAAGELLRFFDADNSATLTSGDVLYLTPVALGANAVVPQYSIRLSGNPTASGSGIGGVGGSGSSTSTSTSATSTSTSATSTSTSATSTSTSATSTSSEPTKTPGFELVALVAALGAALVLVRRKL